VLEALVVVKALALAPEVLTLRLMETPRRPQSGRRRPLRRLLVNRREMQHRVWKAETYVGEAIGPAK
jgi:hypothetical protein